MKARTSSAKRISVLSGNTDKLQPKSSTISKPKEAPCEKTSYLTPKVPSKGEKIATVKKISANSFAIKPKEEQKQLESSQICRSSLNEVGRNDFAHLQQTESLTKISNAGSISLLEELKRFEIGNSLILQFNFMISQIKKDGLEQEENMKEQIYDHLKSLLTLNHQNAELEIALINEKAIYELEEILAIEVPTQEMILKRLLNFSKFASLVESYLKASLRKIYLGRGVVLHIEEMNEFIKISENLMESILEKHKDFFALNVDLQNLVDEIVGCTLEEVGLIQEIISLWMDNEAKIIGNITEAANSKQSNRLAINIKKLIDDI